MDPPPPTASHSHPHSHKNNNIINISSIMVAPQQSSSTSTSTSTSTRSPSSSRTQLPQQRSQPSQNTYSYLMTPEEPLTGSFSQEHHDDKTSKLPPIHGLQSPPTSPAVNVLPDINSLTGFPPSPQYTPQNNHVTGYGQIATSSAHHTPRFGDSALFPPEAEQVQAQSPLFSQREQHPTATPSRVAIVESRRPADHSVAFSLDFPFSLNIHTPKQAEDYWRSCCADAAKLGRITLPLPRSMTIAKRDPISVRQLQSIERTGAHLRTRPTALRTHKVVKPAPSPRRAPASLPPRRLPARPSQKHHSPPSAAVVPQPTAFATAGPTTSRSSPTPRRGSHKASASDDLSKSSKHRRAPASKERPQGEAWDKLPDYCPPLSSLATAPKPLRARPVGSSGALDLSHDPDRAHLHPDELAVAATLRLQCAKYLLNKRKIFRAKVEHLQAAAAAAAAAAATSGSSPNGNGTATSANAAVSNFNKTEAQKACGIDVNKASSLFQAFEDVGWFRREWFEQYL